MQPSDPPSHCNSSSAENYNKALPPSYKASFQEEDSLENTQRIERGLARYNASPNVFKRWLFEILSVITSAFCMGAIIAILVSLKDQPLAKWPLGLSIISLLAKVASAALILPISEAIGQLKWSWFHGKKSKDAFDFEVFDKASRGAWGSMLPLFRTKGKSLAALGALLTVFLLAKDSFFQQVTNLPERWTIRGEGLISRVVRYKPEILYMGDLPVVLQSQDLKGTLTSYFCEQNGTQYSTSRKGSPADFPLSYPTSVVLFSFSTALAGKFSSLQSTYAISYLNLGSIIRHVTFTMKPVIMASIVFQFTLRLTTNELPPKLMPPSFENEKGAPAPNIAERTGEKLWNYDSSGKVLEQWLLETISWLISAICMGAIIAVLVVLRDQPASR